MLPNQGYFRSINCPAVSKNGSCKRPYCHFRHSSTARFSSSVDSNAISLESKTSDPITTETKKETKVANKHPSYSYDKLETTTDSYVPYKPYKANEKDSNLKIAVSENKQLASVLHAARGASSHSRHTNKESSLGVKYSLSSSTKPITDLEYDPLCNFNVKSKSGRKVDDAAAAAEEHKSTDEKFPSIEIIDLTDEALPSSDLVIDDDSLKLTSVQSEDEDDDVIIIEDECDPPTAATKAFTSGASACSVTLQTNFRSSSGIDDDLPSFSSLVSDDYSKSMTLNEHRDGDASVETKPQTTSSSLQEKNIFESDLFGFDGDGDFPNAAFVSRPVASEVSKSCKAKTVLSNNNDKSILSKPSSKMKENNTDTDKQLSKKSSDNEKLKKVKRLKDAAEDHKRKVRKKFVKETEKKENHQRPVKKKLKINKKPIATMEDVARYISKEEMDKLDEELNADGEGMVDQLFQIYREGNTENKHPSKKTEKSGGTSEKIVEKVQEPDYIPPQKSKRVAHTTAENSAKLLNRERKQIGRRLTPAQAMMKRMEIIRQEQEEKLISSAIEKLSSLKGSYFGRTAHKPSSSHIATSSPSMSKKRSIASHSFYGQESAIKKKRPFQDLRSSSPSSSTVQGTIAKGSSRAAHTSKVTGVTDNSPEKPRILPDRHSKVPTNVRQRYLTVFTDECLRICKNRHSKAYEMAKSEEQQCNSRSKSKTIYLSLAASTLKKLRSMQSPEARATVRTDENEKVATTAVTATSDPTRVVFKTNSLRIAHGTSASEATKLREEMVRRKSVEKPAVLNKLVDKDLRKCKGGYSIVRKENEKLPSGPLLYDQLCRYLLTEDELGQNGFPLPGSSAGTCTFMVELPKHKDDPSKKTCKRCGKEFVLFKSGRFARSDDECIHHWGRAYSTKVGSTWEKRYTCCQTPPGSEGCSVAETHVHMDNTYDCGGYVKTLWKASDNSDPGIYALDCEMAFTVKGLELIRVSVVNFDCETVYDSLVKPSGKILDYNTRWSGLAEDDLKGVTTSLRDVQAVLLNKFSSDSILMGHSLESDLKALRIVHSTVVDTSVVFPHRLGPPYKRALRNLMADHLGIIIQNSVDEGHDSMEDATACIKLIKWKLSEDLKVSHERT